MKANEIDATFAGNTAGELRGTGAAGSAPQTMNADTVNLLATDDRGSLKVGEGLAFRGFVRPDTGDEGGERRAEGEHEDARRSRASTSVPIAPGPRSASKSQAGTLAVDDRKLVNGTQLDLSGARSRSTFAETTRWTWTA